MYAYSASANYLESMKIYAGTSRNIEDMPLVQDVPSVPNSSWTQYTVPLDDYVGQNIYIAFRATAKDKLYLCVDDVELWGDVEYYYPDPEDYIGTTPALNVPEVPGEYTRYEVDLPADTTCYVLIRHYCYNQFYLFIDTVDVNEIVVPDDITVETVTVERGVSVPLQYTITPDDAATGVVVEIADTSIATYADGYITGVAGGVTTVTVKSSADQTVYGEATVTVLAPALEYYFDDQTAEGWTLTGFTFDHATVNPHTPEYQLVSGTRGSIAMSPALSIGSAASFKFYVRGEFASRQEDVQVYVGSTPDIEAMTMVYEEASIVNTYHGVEIDLSDYAGQAIYVAVVHSTASADVYMDTFQFWGSVALFNAPVIIASEVALRERNPIDEKADVRYVFTVQFNDSYVNYTPAGGTENRYGSEAVHALEIDAMTAAVQLVPASGTPYTEQTLPIYNIFGMIADAEDPYFQVTLAVAGIKPARFGDSYNARIILSIGEFTVTCDPCEAVVNNMGSNN